MRICLDASVVVDWVLPQGLQGERPLDGLLTQADETLAPALLYAESTSTIRRLVYLRALTDEQGTGSINRIWSLPVTPVHSEELYLGALRLADRLGHGKAYDTQYIAVAESAGATLITADRGMHTNAQRLGIESVLLE